MWVGWLVFDRVMEASVIQISTDLDRRLGLVTIASFDAFT